jgi:hypothetical protein
MRAPNPPAGLELTRRLGDYWTSEGGSVPLSLSLVGSGCHSMGKITARHSSLTPPGNLDQDPGNEIPAAFIATRRPSLIGSRGDTTSAVICR